MGTQLRTKIQKWKEKAISRTKSRSLLMAKLKRKDAQISRLKAEKALLEKIVSPQAVINHSYPAQLIALAVFMVSQAGSSLRCAAKTVHFLSQLMGWSYGIPSHVTIRNWVLRCGLYNLEGGPAKEGEYVGIIDESIQIGREKLLLLLGVKLEQNQSHCMPLIGKDVEVLGMEVQQSWTGEEVADFIEKRLKHHQQIDLRYIISDRGTALLAAFRQLGLSVVSDCTHLMMNAVKKLFKDNEALSELCTQIGQLRRRLILTKDSFLLPPTLRDKDRFLRIFTIVDWFKRLTAYWDKLDHSSRQQLDFLVSAAPLIENLTQIRSLIALTAGILKSSGISKQSQQIWEARLAQQNEQKVWSAESEAFIETVRNYFIQHTELLYEQDRLLCCSDIIESTFGRYKNKGGMAVISADVLTIALYNQVIDVQFVQRALSNTKQNDLQQWHQNYTCDNRYSLIHRMNQEIKNAV